MRYKMTQEERSRMWRRAEQYRAHPPLTREEWDEFEALFHVPAPMSAPLTREDWDEFEELFGVRVPDVESKPGRFDRALGALFKLERAARERDAKEGA